MEEYRHTTTTKPMWCNICEEQYGIEETKNRKCPKGHHVIEINKISSSFGGHDTIQ